MLIMVQIFFPAPTIEHSFPVGAIGNITVSDISKVNPVSNVGNRGTSLSHAYWEAPRDFYLHRDGWPFLGKVPAKVPAKARFLLKQGSC